MGAACAACSLSSLRSALRELQMACQCSWDLDAHAPTPFQPSQQVTAAELRGMLEHMLGLTSLMFDKNAAQRIPAVEWVQLTFG